MYAAIFRRVRPASRDSRRLESAAHSPVYAHFGDALAGKETIAAYAAEARFCERNAQLVADMSRAKVGNEAVNKWAQALTTQTGCLLYACCGLACVLLGASGHLSSSQLGLVLLYASNLQRAAMDVMMQLTSLETQFVSVERLAEYTRLDDDEAELNAGRTVMASTSVADPAAAEVGGSGRPGLAQGAPAWLAPNWRPSGELEVDRLWLRYAPGRAAVLRGVSLHLPAGRKVALCGRTGCGKSSLFGAIARLYPLDSGDVLLDGISAVTALPLAVARRAVRVVSQDALLLDGTLRHNLLMHVDGAHEGPDGEGLEPLRAAHDGELWAALELAGVAERVRALPGGLSARVTRSDFSEGERQLLSLARALVGRPTLLLADEPTACVDLTADARVHDVLLGLDATVLMICHRLQHVARFDEVLVMHAGTIMEHGSPAALLRTHGSRLGKLCRRAGLDAEELLTAALRQRNE